MKQTIVGRSRRRGHTWRLAIAGWLGLLAVGVPAVALAQDSPPAESPPDTFLNWLFSSRNQDADESPRNKRGNTVCLANMAPGTVNRLRGDRPTFVLRGLPRSLALYAPDTPEPIWTHPITRAPTVTYLGPPLIPGITYTLRVQHPEFPQTQYEQRQLQVVDAPTQARVTLELANLTTTRHQAGESPSAIAIAQAEYLWQQGFEPDAWVALLPMRSAAVEVATAVSTGLDRLCSPPALP